LKGPHMAAKLPDGAIVTMATTYGTPQTVTAITNANPAVASSTAHTLVNGDLIELTSGWSNLNGKIVRVASALVNSFALEGIDTTSTTLFPAGSGAGSVRKIATFQQITQILGFTTSGGNLNFVNYSFLEQNFETQLPTIYAAQSISIDIADDATLAGYIAVKAAADQRAVRALRLVLPDGSNINYNGVVSLNETPTVTKGALMAVKCDLSLANRPVRYST
jgi:hypothetical protein